MASKKMGHQTRIYVFQTQACLVMGSIYQKKAFLQCVFFLFFECREDKHIKMSFIIHENTVALSQ